MNLPTSSPARIDLSIVIPCYQEELHLRDSVTQIYNLLQHTKYSFEMIFIDDCSEDKTRDIILEIVKDFPNTRYLFHEQNTGRGGAFMDGVKMAKGKYVGFLDIDLEVSYVYLMKVLPELENGNDIVTVHRHYSIPLSLSFIIRHILSVSYKVIVSNYLEIPRMDTETGFKFFHKERLLALDPLIENKRWFFDTEVMAHAYKNNYKICEVDGLFTRRTDKTSTVRLFHDTIEYIGEVIRFKKRMKKNRIKK